MLSDISQSQIGMRDREIGAAGQDDGVRLGQDVQSPL
jgi:hypothetical protein